MKDSIIMEKADGTKEEFVGGKELVEAVEKASSKEDLRNILHAAEIDGFDEEELEESYKNLALSQNWDAVMELFKDKDYESCSRKLAAHGITTTREHFNLINEVIATASDDDLIRELLPMKDMESTLKTLRRHGYHTMTADFLQLVYENAVHFYEDALLTEEEIRELSGKDFFERCKRSINLIFALSSIAGLALGISSVADPALLIAIAGGVSLMFGRKDQDRTAS